MSPSADRPILAVRSERPLGQVPSLDGLRAVAVLIVMAYHAKVPGFHGGRAGVDVFFVLSGFLITTLLLEEHALRGRIRLGAFYMRRVLRLYPALVLAVIGALALSALKMPVFDASSRSFEETLKASPYALLYTMNLPRAAGWSGGGFLGHTWSLAIEEQFYLVWPVVVVLVMRRWPSRAVVGWIALGCAITSASLRTGLEVLGFDSELLYNATFSHVDGIFIGCAVGVLWLLRRDVVDRLANPVLVALALVASTVIIIRGQNMNEYGFLVIVVATVVVLAHLLVHRASVMSSILSTGAAVAIGRRSYGLYLYHWPIFLFVGIDTRPTTLFLGFGLSFVAAWISYALIEQPFLRKKRRWSVTSSEAEQRGARVPATPPTASSNE